MACRRRSLPQCRPRGWQTLGCWLLGIGLLAGPTGCGSPPARFYTLTALPEVTERPAGIDGGTLTVGVGPVELPQFLDRPQLVARAGENQVTMDEFHRWAGTLEDDFLRVWGENLSHLLGTSRVLVFPREARLRPDFRITAEVLSFEAQDPAEVALRVRWTVLDAFLEQTLVAREDNYRCAIVPAAMAPASGGRAAAAAAAAVASDATVAALSRCLGDFSRDVAGAIRTLPRPQPLALPER
ncbi:MAG: membrane integrity-associated transporter subunit PqiC [Chromatiaceae bacterium]|nr:MAG: membrane integrity-associated transporter subunit PqiC [Chromatiaceae bacterium]